MFPHDIGERGFILPLLFSGLERGRQTLGMGNHRCCEGDKALGQSSERLWDLHPQRHSKWDWTSPWVTCSNLFRTVDWTRDSRGPFWLKWLPDLNRKSIHAQTSVPPPWVAFQVNCTQLPISAVREAQGKHPHYSCRSLFSTSRLTQVSQSYLPPSSSTWDEITQIQPWTQKLTDFVRTSWLHVQISSR